MSEVFYFATAEVELARSVYVCALHADSMFRYLQQNMDWLEEELGGYEDEYLIIDCPGRFICPCSSPLGILIGCRAN